MIDMIVKKKYIQLVLFVLLFSLGACSSDEMSDADITIQQKYRSKWFCN